MLKKNIIAAVTSIGILGFSFSSGASASEPYKVQSGDSLWKIATANGVTVQNLMQWNHLNTSTIYVGQTINIAAPATTVTYVVQPGDSLWKIASSNKMTVAQLKENNNLTSDTIFVGQVLKLNSTSITPPEVKPSLNVEALITEARKYIGVPYVWGGSTPAGFDCSGYLNFVFNKVNISIPRTVATIWSAGKSVSAPQRGDIVFFNTSGSGVSHAGIFLGDNKFIHAGTSTGVTISDLNNSYWKPRYMGAKSYR